MANQTVTSVEAIPTSMAIYTITHRASGKTYVGQTRGDVRRRWSAHCSAKSGAGRSAIKNAILKYGRDAFDFAVIDTAATPAELSHKERHWIATLGTMYPNGYNPTTGGEAPAYSTESRRKMSDAKKALFDKRGRKGRAPWVPRKRRPWTEEEKEYRRQKSLGFTHSDEAKKKIAESKKRRVVRSDGVEFASVTEAAASVGRNVGTLSRLLRSESKRHTCGGFGWRYATEE